MRIMIDPGHGGADPGAVNGELKEKALNMEFAEVLADALTTAGHVLLWTRKEDIKVSIAARAKHANGVAADRFISCHHNAANSTSANGFEALYYPTKTSSVGKRLAIQLTACVASSGLIATRNAKPGWYRGNPERGVLGVLKRTAMPAIIIEAGFLTSSVDRRVLADPKKRLGLYRAIAGYLVDIL